MDFAVWLLWDSLVCRGLRLIVLGFDKVEDASG